MKNRKRRSAEVFQQKELPSLFCVTGRHWVETLEKDPMLQSEEDAVVRWRPRAWVCPFHRGDTPEPPPPPAAVVRKQQQVRAERAMTRQVKAEKVDARKGPRRRVAAIIPRPDGRLASKSTAYGRLECGHECAVPKPRSENGLGWYHCSKCKREERP